MPLFEGNVAHLDVQERFSAKRSFANTPRFEGFSTVSGGGSIDAFEIEDEDSFALMGFVFEPLTANRKIIFKNATGSPVLVGSSTDPPTSGRMGQVDRTAQTAAIASTVLTDATAAGLYRINYYLRCTTADVTAGTISVSFTFTDNVGATTDVSTAIVLTSTVGTGRTQGTFIQYLASGNIAYLTTLTGIIGTSQYQLRVRSEYLG